MQIFEFLTFDVVLFILLLGFVAWGFANGLIKAVGGIIGIIVAVFVAGHFYLFLTGLIGRFFGPFQNAATILSFIFLFLLAGRLFGYVVLLVEKAFNIIAFIPFLKSINRLAGAFFGLILGALVLGTILYVIGKYSQWESFNNAVVASELAKYILFVSDIVRPLFPEAVRQLRSYF